MFSPGPCRAHGGVGVPERLSAFAAPPLPLCPGTWGLAGPSLRLTCRPAGLCVGSVGLTVTGQRAGAVQVAGVSRCVCEQRGPAWWGVTRLARPRSGHGGRVGPPEDAGLFLEAGSRRPPHVGWTVWPGWRPGRRPLGARPRGGLWGEWGPGHSEGRRHERGWGRDGLRSRQDGGPSPGWMLRG